MLPVVAVEMPFHRLTSHILGRVCFMAGICPDSCKHSGVGVCMRRNRPPRGYSNLPRLCAGQRTAARENANRRDWDEAAPVKGRTPHTVNTDLRRTALR